MNDKPAKPKIRLGLASDHIKANWCVYECEVEMPDGSIRKGYVQSDGHLIAEDTLEFEDE
jgi:hypothetical protein